MEEETTNIIKVIATIEEDKKTYSIDIDDSNTFYEFKKILSAAAHLFKNNFRIYHKDQEYTNEYNDNTLRELFPQLQICDLIIKKNSDLSEYEKDFLSVKLSINAPCENHNSKYKVLYCFTCNKSICIDCYTISHEHINHKIEEKSDYIAPAELLMNNIFKNAPIFRADPKVSKYMDSIKIRSELKENLFENLRKLINNIENKFSLCLQYFSEKEDLSERNTNNNIDFMKKYCIEYFIKLKNDIEMNHIMIDDEIFLTIYQKLKQISKYKDEYFQFNQKKYEKLNSLLHPFITQIENITNELKYNFEQILNKDIYENFTKLVNENTVELIQKEEISDLMFNNIMITRKSLFHPLIGVISKDNQQRNKSLINKTKFASLNNENENKPFILISSSKQREKNFESSSNKQLKLENKKIEIKKKTFQL